MNAARPEEHRDHHHRRRIGFPNRRSECCTNCFYTVSYLFCETVSFAAFLSLAIGCGAFAAFVKEYVLSTQNGKNPKMSPFFQTYITLFVLYNLSYLQARHQRVYIYPLRARFGNQRHFFFKCNYPASISFFVLVAAYVNLFDQFSKLLCPWTPINNTNNNFLNKSQSNPSQLNSEDTQMSSPMSFSSWSCVGGGDDGGVTTALFLLSLSTIEYLSARKLRWDFYLELSRMENPPPVFRSCLLYMYAIISLSILQLLLTFLYAMPLLLWLLLCRLFQWRQWFTFLTTCSWSIVIGYLSFFVERQEPFPTLEHSRSYHIANLHVRGYLMCGLFIPMMAYWYFRDDICISTTLLKNSMDVDVFNLFLLNVAVCIMTMVKYVALTSHSLRLRDHRPGVQIVVQRNDGQNNNNNNNPPGPDEPPAPARPPVPPPQTTSNNNDGLLPNRNQEQSGEANNNSTLAENNIKEGGSTTSLRQINGSKISSKKLINVSTNRVMDITTTTTINAGLNDREMVTQAGTSSEKQVDDFGVDSHLDGAKVNLVSTSFINNNDRNKSKSSNHSLTGSKT